MTYRKGGQIISDMAEDMAKPGDHSGEMLHFLDALEDPDPNVRQAAVLGRLRLRLETAVVLRKYDRVDADTLKTRDITAEYVIIERGHEITDFESFYDDQCMRVVFNDNENDFVAAYFTLELAEKELTWR